MDQHLHVKTIGKGPPLVMLHGWGWHSGIWQPLIPQLSQYYQLFLIDLPGFGDSRMQLSHYTFDAIANLLFDVVPERATWLGWSLGGMLAWWVAIHYPEKISQLITVASSPRFLQDENWPGVTLPTLEKFADSLANNLDQTLQDFLALQLRGSPKNAELFAALKTQLNTTNKPHQDALYGGLILLRDADFRKDIRKIQIPSLHIFGRLDTLVPSTVTTYIQPLLSHGRCEIIHRAGHIPFLSQQDTFLALLAVMLK